MKFPSIGLTDTGAGPPIVLLHSSASTRRQWSHLIRDLVNRHRMLAMDLYGYGETPFPKNPKEFHLGCEVDLVERILDLAGEPVHLIGHSYGGAVALKTALRHPGLVRSVVVHEPVLFSLLRIHEVEESWGAIRGLCAGIAENVGIGRNDLAAELFIDYWSLPGTWSRIPAERKPEFERVAPKVVLDFTALFTDEDPSSSYRLLPMPVLITFGSETPESAQQVAALLGGAGGQIRTMRLEAPRPRERGQWERNFA